MKIIYVFFLIGFFGMPAALAAENNKYEAHVAIPTYAHHYLGVGPMSTILYHMFDHPVSAEGDINEDGVISCYDYDLALLALDTKPGDLYWDSRADLVSDASVDEKDLELIETALVYDLACEGLI